MLVIAFVTHLRELSFFTKFIFVKKLPRSGQRLDHPSISCFVKLAPSVCTPLRVGAQCHLCYSQFLSLISQSPLAEVFLVAMFEVLIGHKQSLTSDIIKAFTSLV